MSDLSTSNVILAQSDIDLNNSTNSTFNSSNNDLLISYEAMHILFLAIATITVLICFTICITVCICICIKRRRDPNQLDTSDQLLPEQSSKKTSKFTTSNSIKINGKPERASQPATITSSTNTAVKSFYYDNLDDIPFIDESRPTSVVDITQV